MSAPNSSVAITAGSGTSIASNLVSGSQYQAVVVADNTGNILGSRADWMAYFTPTTNAASREAAELFNASSTAIVRVRGIWIIPTQTAITGVQIGFDVNKISAVGTGGTSVTPRAMDSTQTALDANITAHFGSSAGATLNFLMWELFFFNDETNPSTPLQATYNQLPEMGDHTVEVVLRQNEGLQVKQSVSASVGLTGVLMYFTSE